MSGDGVFEHHPILGWIPSAPEPFWSRSWRTWFRWRPACYPCRVAFKTRDGHDRHWVTTHAAPPEDEK